jgi:hypothetical protein
LVPPFAFAALGTNGIVAVADGDAVSGFFSDSLSDESSDFAASD